MKSSVTLVEAVPGGGMNAAECSRHFVDNIGEHKTQEGAIYKL